jgi:hypothetical protein
MPYRVEIQGLRDLQGRFAAMTAGGLRELQMVEAASLATVIEDVYRRHAPRSARLPKNKPHHFFEGLTATASMGPGGFEIQTETDDPQLARWLSEGTHAHIILPVEKQALWWPSAAHPVRMVHHPGTRANPWAIAAYLEVRPLAEAAGNRIGVRVVQSLAGGV